MNGKMLSQEFRVISAIYPDCHAVKLTIAYQRWFISECQRQIAAQIDLILLAGRKPH